MSSPNPNNNPISPSPRAGSHSLYPPNPTHARRPSDPSAGNTPNSIGANLRQQPTTGSVAAPPARPASVRIRRSSSALNNPPPGAPSGAAGTGGSTTWGRGRAGSNIGRRLFNWSTPAPAPPAPPGSPALPSDETSAPGITIRRSTEATGGSGIRSGGGAVLLGVETDFEGLDDGWDQMPGPEGGWPGTTSGESAPPSPAKVRGLRSHPLSQSSGSPPTSRPGTGGSGFRTGRSPTPPAPGGRASPVSPASRNSSGFLAGGSRLRSGTGGSGERGDERMRSQSSGLGGHQGGFDRDDMLAFETRVVDSAVDKDEEEMMSMRSQESLSSHGGRSGGAVGGTKSQQPSGRPLPPGAREGHTGGGSAEDVTTAQGESSSGGAMGMARTLLSGMALAVKSERRRSASAPQAFEPPEGGNRSEEEHEGVSGTPSSTPGGSRLGVPRAGSALVPSPLGVQQPVMPPPPGSSDDSETLAPPRPPKPSPLQNRSRPPSVVEALALQQVHQQNPIVMESIEEADEETTPKAHGRSLPSRRGTADDLIGKGGVFGSTRSWSGSGSGLRRPSDSALRTPGQTPRTGIAGLLAPPQEGVAQEGFEQRHQTDSHQNTPAASPAAEPTEPGSSPTPRPRPPGAAPAERPRSSTFSFGAFRPKSPFKSSRPSSAGKEAERTDRPPLPPKPSALQPKRAGTVDGGSSVATSGQGGGPGSYFTDAATGHGTGLAPGEKAPRSPETGGHLGSDEEGPGILARLSNEEWEAMQANGGAPNIVVSDPEGADGQATESGVHGQDPSGASGVSTGAEFPEAGEEGGPRASWWRPRGWTVGSGMGQSVSNMMTKGRDFAQSGFGGSEDTGRPETAVEQADRERREEEQRERWHDDAVVDYLDIVDPEISALSTYSNVSNSLFVPNLPFLYSRTPIVDLPARRRPRSATVPSQLHPPDQQSDALRPSSPESLTSHPSVRIRRRPSISSSLRRKQSERRPSVLSRISQNILGGPPDPAAEREKIEREKEEARIRAEEEEEKEFLNELDEHVRTLLRKRERFKRGLRAFGKFVRTPAGAFTTFYAFSITFWGTAIVLFILKWINVHNSHTQRYWIEICDQILCALFALVGIGMFPFRIRDTYWMIWIVHYHRLTWKIREERGMPQLQNRNALPSRNLDPEEARYAPKDEEIVLTPKQQERLIYYQTKFHSSHTFYRSHETSTHVPFPLRLMVIIVIMCDMHSCLQSALGGVTWGINYHHRPTVLSATIVTCSLSCNIGSGLLIWYGTSKTKKKEEVERRLRMALEDEALKRMKTIREKEEHEADEVVGKRYSAHHGRAGLKRSLSGRFRPRDEEALHEDDGGEERLLARIRTKQERQKEEEGAGKTEEKMMTDAEEHGMERNVRGEGIPGMLAEMDDGEESFAHVPDGRESSDTAMTRKHAGQGS